MAEGNYNGDGNIMCTGFVMKIIIICGKGIIIQVSNRIITGSRFIIGRNYNSS